MKHYHRANLPLLSSPVQSSLPNNKMKTLFVLAAVLVAVCAQAPYQPVDLPIPYSFSYVAEGEEGTSSHQETGDGSGRVQGSYSLVDIDGNNRVVEYIADEDGYRATIRTNEPGTDNKNPADVIIESTAPGVGAGVSHRSAAVSTTRVTSGGVSTGGRGGAGSRYVLVPITDPRAQGYY